MVITGVIHQANLEKRFFSIKKRDGLVFYYLQNNLIKKFRKYLHKGRFVQFEAEDDSVLMENHRVYRVKHFIKIIRKRVHQSEVYYDIDIIRQGIIDLVNSLDHMMFLDLEMSMHDWNVSPQFKSEIIQVGYIITDSKGTMLDKKSYYVKPSVYKKISQRTKNFLHISDEDLKNGLTYNEFYSDFSNVLRKFSPTIIVWGKNDILSLKNSYELNDLPSLQPLCNFVNILQVQKNFFNLKSDLGLFKAQKAYLGEDYQQEHDALDDARVTKNVFFAFRDCITSGKVVHFD